MRLEVTRLTTPPVNLGRCNVLLTQGGEITVQDASGAVVASMVTTRVMSIGLDAITVQGLESEGTHAGGNVSHWLRKWELRQ